MCVPEKKGLARERRLGALEHNQRTAKILIRLLLVVVVTTVGIFAFVALSHAPPPRSEEPYTPDFNPLLVSPPTTAGRSRIIRPRETPIPKKTPPQRKISDALVHAKEENLLGPGKAKRRHSGNHHSVLF